MTPGRGLGLDVSPDPLDEARAAASNAGVEVSFAVGDVYALDLPDASFDVVHAHQVLQHLTDPVVALRDVTASAWCYASAGERAWWGRSWTGRATASAFAEQAVAYGLATPEELAEVADAWLRWAAADDGWLGMLHGELLIRV